MKVKSKPRPLCMPEHEFLDHDPPDVPPADRRCHACRLPQLNRHHTPKALAQIALGPLPCN